MDASRFDTLTRHVVARATRRRLLRGIGALALGAPPLLGLAGAATAGDGVNGERCNKECLRRCKRRNRDNRGRCRAECCDDDFRSDGN